MFSFLVGHNISLTCWTSNKTINTGALTEDTSEKEIEAEAAIEPLGRLPAEASDLEPFNKPLPPGLLTGKKEGSRTSSDVHFS